MLEIHGNLFEQFADAICIPTNCYVKKDGSAVMGRGVALELVQRFPGIAFRLAEVIQIWGEETALLTEEDEDGKIFVPEQEYPVIPWHIVAFPTKPAYEEVYPGGMNVLEQYRAKFDPGHSAPGWAMKSNLALIKRSAETLVEFADLKGWDRVALPRVGSGNGGLKWNEVRELLSLLLDNRFLIFTP